MREKWSAAAYRAARVDIGGVDGDPHRFHRRLQDHGEFSGGRRLPQAGVHRFEAYDFLETIADSEAIERFYRVDSVGIRENLPINSRLSKNINT